MKKRFRKIIAVLLTIIIILSSLVFSSVSVEATQDRTYNFYTNYNLTGNPVDDIVSVAMAQQNRTKASMGYTEAWCADFVGDCADLAGLGYAIPRAGYCGTLWDNIINAGGYEVTSPKKGDIIFYYCTASYCPNSGAPWVHVGIMTSSSSSIEGNSGGKVTAKSTITYTDTNGHTYGHSGTNSVIVKYLRPKYKDVPDDHDGPSVDNFRVGEFQSNQFTVYAHITDPGGVRSVQYAVWTENNGQDDIKWYDGHCTDGNDYYWSHIVLPNHNNENGRYIIHLYAYDNAGNLSNPGISYDISSNGPTYTDFHIGELRDGAFTIIAKVTDVNGISSVKYAVWTDNNGQDDLKWYTGQCTDNNDYYWARVNMSEHNNERGNYTVHMYAYDIAGKLTNPGITYHFPENGPTISDVNVSDVSSRGYTITCKVSTEIGVSKVQFPTWTDKDGQDDLAPEWWNNEKVRGTINGDTVSFRVNTSDHNNEAGIYSTHIYAYDTVGTSSRYIVPSVEIAPDTISPICESSWIDNISQTSYRVNVIPNDNEGIKRVEVATWTRPDQSDIKWNGATYAGNGVYYVDINRSDYSDYSNSYYNNHIYAYDFSGNYFSVACNQDYKITSDTGKLVSEGEYRIVSAVNESRALDVANGSANSGANIQIYNNFISPKQTFKLTYLNNGFYTIANSFSNYLLDVEGDTYLNNTNVVQCAANGGANQEWMIKPTGTDDGYYYIISHSNGLALDVFCGEDKDGTNVQVYSQNQTSAQKWKLRRVIKQDMVKVVSWELLNGIMKPNVKVIVDGHFLVENTDYTVSSYIENDVLHAKITGIENYCDSVSIEYQDVNYEIGDTNLDGHITISDVTAIQRHLAELDIFSDEQLALADTNGDGEINIGDATHLQKYLAEFDGIVLGKA